MRPRQLTTVVVGMLAWTQAARSDAAEGILVLRSRDLPQYTAAANDFLEAWQERGDGRPARAENLDESGAITNRRPGAPARPVAVVAIGAEAMAWAVAHTGGPVVCCLVASTPRSWATGLPPAQAARVSGVSLQVPVKTQWQQLGRFLPRVRRIGLLYDPGQSAGVAREATRAAAELGFKLSLAEVPAESALPTAVNRLVGGIDLLWAPADDTVYNSHSTQFVLRQMLQHRVPVMGFSENMVRAGALLAVRLDYRAIGHQAAGLLQAALAGQAVAGGPIQPPRVFQVVVNARVLNLLGNPIPPAPLRLAHLVNDED